MTASPGGAFFLTRFENNIHRLGSEITVITKQLGGIELTASTFKTRKSAIDNAEARTWLVPSVALGWVGYNPYRTEAT